MAGSYKHIVKNGTYLGLAMLEDMGDMAEAVEQMAFMILVMERHWPLVVENIEEHYFRCCRGEEPWPEWFRRDV